MAQPPARTITHLLHSVQAGDQAAFDALYKEVYTHLRGVAANIRRQRPSDTLNTTALVHEAYLKLVPGPNVDWQNRAHFYAVAARAMRQVLVSYAEKRMRLKRGGGQIQVPLEEGLLVTDERCASILALHEALERLAARSPRQSQVVEYRFFGGLTIEETAHVLDCSPRTLHRDWNLAKAWLSGEIKQAL